MSGAPACTASPFFGRGLSTLHPGRPTGAQQRNQRGHAGGTHRAGGGSNGGVPKVGMDQTSVLVYFGRSESELY